MGQSVDQALITEFSDLVHQEAQQMTARMKPYVNLKQMEGDVFAYDGLGRVEARELQGRYNKTEFDDIEHSRRKIRRRRFVVTLPIDASDVRGALMNPDSEYSKACVNAMSRQTDRVISDAAFADVLSGRDFENTVTFADDGGLEVDATSGMTYDTLLEIHENFINEDVGTEMDEKMFLTITGKEHTQLMNETELTSGDFTRQYAIEEGKIVKATGIDLLHYAANVPQPIFGNVGGERNLIAASSRGICMGISKEMGITIVDRDDYVETSQVQIVMEIGAVRTEGSLVQKVRVTA